MLITFLPEIKYHTNQLIPTKNYQNIMRQCKILTIILKINYYSENQNAKSSDFGRSGVSACMLIFYIAFQPVIIRRRFFPSQPK